jgi:hypothetical protein
MKLSRLILSIVILFAFSSYAGASIINLGNGAFYYTGLSITQPQIVDNSYLSQAAPVPVVPVLNGGSTLLEPEVVNVPAVVIQETGTQVYTPKNIKKVVVGPTGSDAIVIDVPGQSDGESNPAAPVPEPATLLLLGTGLLMFVASFKKLQWLS